MTNEESARQIVVDEASRARLLAQARERQAFVDALSHGQSPGIAASCDELTRLYGQH